MNTHYFPSFVHPTLAMYSVPGNREVNGATSSLSWVLTICKHINTHKWWDDAEQQEQTAADALFLDGPSWSQPVSGTPLGFCSLWIQKKETVQHCDSSKLPAVQSCTNLCEDICRRPLSSLPAQEMERGLFLPPSHPLLHIEGTLFCPHQGLIIEKPRWLPHSRPLTRDSSMKGSDLPQLQGSTSNQWNGQTLPGWRMWPRPQIWGPPSHCLNLEDTPTCLFTATGMMWILSRRLFNATELEAKSNQRNLGCSKTNKYLTPPLIL